MFAEYLVVHQWWDIVASVVDGGVGLDGTALLLRWSLEALEREGGGFRLRRSLSVQASHDKLRLGTPTHAGHVHAADEKMPAGFINRRVIIVCVCDWDFHSGATFTEGSQTPRECFGEGGTFSAPPGFQSRPTIAFFTTRPATGAKAFHLHHPCHLFLLSWTPYTAQRLLLVKSYVLLNACLWSKT